MRWPGAAVYCNWLSAQERRWPLCYNTTTWDCDFNTSGFRLPTEAEWEYQAAVARERAGRRADGMTPSSEVAIASDATFRAGLQFGSEPRL